MIVVARSSGRTSFSEPLNARPMGERAVATMTASGIGTPAVLVLTKVTIGECLARYTPGASSQDTGRLAAAAIAGSLVGPRRRVRLRRLDRGQLAAAAVPQQRPPSARAAVSTADLGRSDLRAGLGGGLGSRLGDGPYALAA